MGNSIIYRADNGIPGAVSRPDQQHIESQPLDAANVFSQYGLPGKIVNSLFRPISATGEAAYGWLVRPFPTQGPNASDPVGSATPPTSGVANILRRGYISAKCNAGTPALNSAVYIRFQNPSGAQIVGGVEAAAHADTYVLPGAVFTGTKDANGNVEIAFNI